MKSHNEKDNSKKIRVCFTCSAGGHFEQIRQLTEVESEFECTYLLPKNSATLKFGKNKDVTTFLSLFHGPTYLPRMIVGFVQHFIFFIIKRPDVVVTTGASAVIPICLIMKLFRRRLIYIESFARIHELNKTGRFLYPFSDVFIVQWPELKEKYPNAIYGGWIY